MSSAIRSALASGLAALCLAATSASAANLDAVKASCTKSLGEYFKTNERFEPLRSKAAGMCDCIVDRTAESDRLTDAERAKLYAMYGTTPGSTEARAARKDIDRGTRDISRNIVVKCRSEAMKPS